MYSVGSPWRDKQQDPYIECAYCGCEVYIVPEDLFDTVVCDECKKREEAQNERR